MVSCRPLSGRPSFRSFHAGRTHRTNQTGRTGKPLRAHQLCSGTRRPDTKHNSDCSELFLAGLHQRTIFAGLLSELSEARTFRNPPRPHFADPSSHRNLVRFSEFHDGSLQRVCASGSHGLALLRTSTASTGMACHFALGIAGRANNLPVRKPELRLHPEVCAAAPSVSNPTHLGTPCPRSRGNLCLISFRDGDFLRPQYLRKQSNHRLTMTRYYRTQAHFYDATRWMFLYGRERLVDELDIRPGERVVEIGCGTGKNFSAIQRKLRGSGEIVGIDCSAPMLGKAEQRIRQAEWDNVRLLNLEYGTESVTRGRADVVILSYSLSMIPEWQLALSCAHSELWPGGRIGVVDFYGSANSSRWFTQWL